MRVDIGLWGLSSGDRVLAVEGLGGGFLWPRVPAGTAGVVARDHGDLTYAVHFANGRTVRVSADQIALRSTQPA